MNNSIILNDLSEKMIDKVIINSQTKAGDWGFILSNNESWFFTFTNYDNSSKTAQCY
jgi:hypothetical protein